MPDKNVVLGFSGGMDSVTAAKKLSSEGWRVVAVTLDTVGDSDMLAKARRVAEDIQIEHHIVDVKTAFQRDVIDYFISEYKRGHTPAPCTVCNSAIKWRYLIAQADKLGIEKVATGHYFRVERKGDRWFVVRAADLVKDQSYYLWNLPQSVLSRVITPMSDMIKSEVRENFTDKRESMGVCFLRGRSYREFLIQHAPEVLRSGDIVKADGCVVGRHDGVAFYTIGQKRGMELSESGLAVVAVDAEQNRIVVGEHHDLYKSKLEIMRCNFADEEQFILSDDVSLVVRGIGRNPEGFIRSKEPILGGYSIELEHPAFAPAVGQPVVFYRRNTVLGGGFISRYF